MDATMTLDEFCKEYRVPLATARYWRATGKGGPRTYLRGGRVMVRRSDVEAWDRESYEASNPGDAA